MGVTYEHTEHDQCGDATLTITCQENEVTIEDSSGRRCSLEYDQLEIINAVVKKYKAMEEVANA